LNIYPSPEKKTTLSIDLDGGAVACLKVDGGGVGVWLVRIKQILWWQEGYATTIL